MGSHKLGTITTGLLVAMAGAAPAGDKFSFEMIVSPGAKACLPDARADVTIDPTGEAEDLFISASGLPPKTAFDFFVIQVPNAPFGLSWYQGDLESNGSGNAVGHFRGRFNIETFIVAPNVAEAPVVFTDTPFPDVTNNPATGPVHTYHLGLWFNSPRDAAKAGCASTVTAFNGEHMRASRC